MVLFLLCIVWIWFAPLSQLVLCHIYDMLYASISSVYDSDITWFVTHFIQLILVSIFFIFVLLLVEWDYFMVQFQTHVCLLCWFFTRLVNGLTGSTYFTMDAIFMLLCPVSDIGYYWYNVNNCNSTWYFHISLILSLLLLIWMLWCMDQFLYILVLSL